jgi:hypothetical protein
MSNFSAIVPVAQMAAANAELEAQGFGPENFSVPAFSGAQPSHAMFHAWSDPVFEAAVVALPGVTVSYGNPADNPRDVVTGLATSVGASWSDSALPFEGVVTPGLHYRMVGNQQEFWWVIQQYDTAIWPDPSAPGLQALVVPARIPGEVTIWVQPINQFTAYFLVNQFTGKPDEVTHNGQTWYVSQGDGAGLALFEPGVFGWTVRT